MTTPVRRAHLVVATSDSGGRPALRSAVPAPAAAPAAESVLSKAPMEHTFANAGPDCYWEITTVSLAVPN